MTPFNKGWKVNLKGHAFSLNVELGFEMPYLPPVGTYIHYEGKRYIVCYLIVFIESRAVEIYVDEP